jgi:hypothetical protein
MRRKKRSKVLLIVRWENIECRKQLGGGGMGWEMAVTFDVPTSVLATF